MRMRQDCLVCSDGSRGRHKDGAGRSLATAPPHAVLPVGIISLGEREARSGRAVAFIISTIQRQTPCRHALQQQRRRSWRRRLSGRCGWWRSFLPILDAALQHILLCAALFYLGCPPEPQDDGRKHCQQSDDEKDFESEDHSAALGISKFPGMMASSLRKVFALGDHSGLSIS